ncbi:hypothetical protein DFQ28_005735 [Apophysomyces sp. BC1034]|nr:hypothetical protein DFQ30_003792 [Apophysomyces sp. BC1015]KAG0182613.1 hypothetical protein DFQ29_003166 [Apophysomyces sp. BC1021]KAG0193292.1 hypothetical protein DFQ28_005735 [Apophysomyces sp. BC1034]
MVRFTSLLALVAAPALALAQTATIPNNLPTDMPSNIPTNFPTDFNGLNSDTAAIDSIMQSISKAGPSAYLSQAASAINQLPSEYRAAAASQYTAASNILASASAHANDASGLPSYKPLGVAAVLVSGFVLSVL